jgi:hypothetical protein
MASGLLLAARDRRCPADATESADRAIRDHLVARSGSARADAEAIAAVTRAIYGLLGPRRGALCTSAHPARGLHVREDRAFGA